MLPTAADPALLPRLRDQAAELGFDLFGVAPAVTPNGYADLLRWIDAGYAAEMHYFAARAEAYGDPGLVLAGARSIIVLSYPYDRGLPLAAAAEHGTAVIARYARSGLDYHDVIHPLLKQLCATIGQFSPHAQSRGVVDTAPLMEREFATLAGLGWAGKNSLLLHRQRGSYFFLAAILTTLDLPFSEPHLTAHCGSCTRCLDACPTEAFVGPGIVDAGRCISYLTIEHRGPIDPELRSGIGDRLFGCDICQEVCPWNARAQRLQTAQPLPPAAASPAAISTTERSASPVTSPQASGFPQSDLPWDRQGRIDLLELLQIDDEEFRRRFRRTALWRPRRRGLVRNAAICAGNARLAEALPALRRLVQDEDEDEVIRESARWAIDQITAQPPASAASNSQQP